jgi:high affinity Mn2+ porin
MEHSVKAMSYRKSQLRTRVRVAAMVLTAISCGSVLTPASAADDESWAVHAQFTYVEQDTADFAAPYRGTNSLSPDKGAETTDATLYVGVRPWRGAELWINPELDQGFGLDDTLGAAGFPSGEAFKIGENQPYFRLQRFLLRQTFDLNGDLQPLQAALNQLAGSHSSNRVVITIGKFSVTDVFDTNRYAQDQRSAFLNWTAIDTGTFDYAADAWGYTVGAALEWYEGAWAVRGGLFDLSTIPNSPHLDPGSHEFQIVVEGEHRHSIAGREGRVLLTAFDSRGRMGLLDQAVQLAQATDTLPNVADVRAYRTRLGADVNFEQQLGADCGVFGRIGKAAGNVETFEFTDVDRTAALGLSLQGAAWRRIDDTIGIAAINNNASAARQRYLNAGGLGILVGDGKLPHPGPEQIIETYYSAAFLNYLHLSLDYQWINHPAYNRDRGPVSVFAVRVHAQY